MESLQTITVPDCQQAHDSVLIDTYQSHITSLLLTPEDVTKTIPNRITSMTFHPSHSRTIICTGDKYGYVSIWDAGERGSQPSRVNMGGQDGVYLYKLHSSNVCALHVAPEEPQRIWSVSYDGSVRFSDLEQAHFACAHQSEVHSFTMAAFGQATNSACGISNLLTCTYKGSVCCLDARAGGIQWTNTVNIDISQKCYKLNTIQLHPTVEHMVITAGANGHVGVFDLRQRGSSTWKAVSLLTGHHNSVYSAQVSPNGQYLVSVGVDDTVKLWYDFMVPSEKQMISYAHNNQTGRWLSTFQPVFDPKHPHAFFLGSMGTPRNVELHVISSLSPSPCTDSTPSTSSKKRKAPLEPRGNFGLNPCIRMMGEELKSVCSRLCVHPSRNMVAGGNSSGKVFLFR